MKNFHTVILLACAAVCFAFSCGVSEARAQKKKAAETAAKSAARKNQKTQTETAAAKTKTASSAAAPKKKQSAAKTPEKTKTSDKSKTAAKSKTAVVKPPAKSAPNSKDKTATRSKEKNSAAKPTAAKSASAKTAGEKKAAQKKPATGASKASGEKSAAESTNAAAKSGAQKSAAMGAQIIIAVASALARGAPNRNAAVVSTLNIGKIFSVAEENPSWYRVEFAGGRSGWVSKQVASEFSDARRAEIYRKIVGKFFNGKMDFATAAQIFDFLTVACGEIKTLNAQGDFNFKRLEALAAALKAIPSGKGDAENPYKTFLKTNEAEVVYSEPSGEWLVRSNVFWETHARYKDLPVGEEIAHLAAETPLPGECEGYVNCYIYLLRVTDGEYLNFYPNGKYARKSIQNITAMLDPIVADLKTKTVYTAATDISDRADFNRLLTELRQIISKVPFAEKSKAIQQINQIGEGFR